MIESLMKKIAILSTILIILLTILVSSSVKETKELVSPMLKIKTGLPVGRQVLGINQWFPKEQTTRSVEINGNSLQITAKAALFLDSKDGKVFYSKNVHQRLPIASLVKVMTVLVALEHKNMDDKYLVSQRASEMEPDEMILLPGETLTLRELLFGIFLVSANDAAEVLAEGSVGSRDEFIKLMNDKTKLLGMKDSYFVNPTGLDEDSNNSYSSVFDLAILTRYLIRNYPEVVDISRSEHIYLPKTSDHQDYDMYSGINLLTTYPGVVGFKTGYTPEAGLTLITLARKDGKEIIGVLLGSGDRRDEARELLDYSFGKL